MDQIFIGKIALFIVLIIATFKSVEESHYSKNKGYKFLAVFCGIMTALQFAEILIS